MKEKKTEIRVNSHPIYHGTYDSSWYAGQFIMVRDNNEESILRIIYVEINDGTNEHTRIEQ